jgi:hypothetical protein
VTLKQWQLDAILNLDLKRREMAAKQTEKAEEKQDVSARPLSSRLFDALFPAKRK